MPATNADPGALLADWRHLGVLPRSGRALVIGGEYPDLQDVFETTEIGGWDQIPDTPGIFQLIVACNGLDSPGAVGRVERALDPSEGVLMVCAPPIGTGGRLHPPLAVQVRSTRRLLQGSGLEVRAVYGALPDPASPEYVFPLTGAAAAFAIERYVLSRRPAWGWVRPMLGVKPIIAVGTSVLPGGYILCRRRGDGA